MIKRDAIAKATAVAVLAILAILVLAGAVGIYYYTATPGSASSSSSSQSRTSSTSAVTGGPAGGHCETNAQGQCETPEGVWAAYLGYLPAGYILAPHDVNAYTFPCPSGMDATQCSLFQASCGNGVCDPNESCATCPYDCGVAGQLTCDPYTGRPGAPLSICEVAYQNQPGG